MLRCFGALRQLVSKSAWQGLAWPSGPGDCGGQPACGGVESRGLRRVWEGLNAPCSHFRDLRFNPGVWLGRGYEVHISQRRVLLFLDAEAVVGLGNAEEAGLCS